MSLAIRDAMQMLAGDRLPIYRATTEHLAVTFPFQAESGLIDPRTGMKVPGIPRGYCGRDRSGGIFSFDETQLYQAGLIQNTNVKVFGEIGNRKSTDMKCMIYRGSAFGYNHLVTDRKDEYKALAQMIKGSRILRFGEDSDLYINALDSAMDIATQNTLVGDMALTALGGGRTELDIVEKSLLWFAIEDAHRGRTAILPNLVDRLFDPTAEMAQAMHRSADVVREQGYHLALALQRLTTGDLRGMFHEATTDGLFEETPLLVLSCAGIRGEAAVIMITLLNFFTQSLWSGRNPKARFHKIIHDEAWDLANYPGFVNSIRTGFKLGGTWGVSNYIVAHHKTNLDRSGKDEAIKDLIADSDTTILYKQDDAELRRSAEELKLNEADIRQIVKLPPGTALWKIADLPCIRVEQDVWPEERDMVQTRHLLHGKTDLPRAIDEVKK